MNARSVAVLVPVLGRPHLVELLASNLRTSVIGEMRDGWNVEIVFVCSPGDDDEIAAINRWQGPDVTLLIAEWPAGPGDYARKINFAAQRSDATWFFTAADDLNFHAGWLRAAITKHVRTGALVVGTNDLSNPYVMRGLYATHLLVHRDWMALGTIDEPGLIFHEGYDHNCPDTELVETAKARGSWVFAKDAHVEHMHPSFRKGHDDATYAKGRAHHPADRELLNRRRVLWREAGPRRRRLRAAGR